MITYEFWAIENIGRATISDRYKLMADSFAEACLIAEQNENLNALEEDREPTIYNEFKQIN